MTHRMCAVCLAVALATAGGVGSAHAQAASEAEVRDLEARARFESGRLAFEAGRYEEALADFERSYELSGRAIILFNIGLVHDRLRRDQAALDAFERYLAEVPAAPNRAEVEARAAVLRAQLAESAVPVPVPTPAPGPSHRVEYEIWAWISTGLTLAAAPLAGALWSLANDEYARLDVQCGEAGCARSAIDASGAPALVDGTNAMLVTAIVAGLSAVTAWTLYFVDVPSPSAPSPSVRLGPGTLRVTF